MTLTKEKKSHILDELKGLFSDSAASVGCDYSGLTASELNELRKNLRDQGVVASVTKNTLVRKTLEAAGLEIDQSILDKPVIFAFGKDEVEVCKNLHLFSKDHEKLELLGGIINGEPVDADRVKALALLPGREESQGKLVGILASPIYGLVNVLHGNIRGLVSVLKQFQQKSNN